MVQRDPSREPFGANIGYAGLLFVVSRKRVSEVNLARFKCIPSENESYPSPCARVADVGGLLLEHFQRTAL